MLEGKRRSKLYPNRCSSFSEKVVDLDTSRGSAGAEAVWFVLISVEFGGNWLKGVIWPEHQHPYHDVHNDYVE
jgi:hypothetical protein